MSSDTLRRGIAYIFGLVFFMTPVFVVGQSAIEPGQYISASLDTNTSIHSYTFYAEASEVIIVRVANEDLNYQDVPNLYLSYVATIPMPSTNVSVASATNSAAIAAQEIIAEAPSTGWYLIRCELPPARSTIEDTLSYSVSMLRMPDVQLSVYYPDVGPIRSGDSLNGVISVGADLDAATFSVSTNCTVLLRMGQKNVHLVPSMRLFDPTGVNITNAPVTEFRAELSVVLTNAGIYTVVCSDHLNGKGDYNVSMVQIPSEDNAVNGLGKIIPGETLTGTIKYPAAMGVATFMGANGDAVKLTMTEIDATINPIMHLYDPVGGLIEIGVDPLQRSVVITHSITTNGVYTVVCMDKQDQHNVRYTLTMDLVGGPSANNVPAAPTGVSATDGVYEDHVVITWSSVSGANGYDVWRSYGTNEPTQLCTNNVTLAYKDYDVTSGMLYFYKIRARNDYGVGSFSASDSGYSGSVSPASLSRRALVVGINKYSPVYGPSPLNFCVADAEGIRDVMLLGDPSNRWVSTNIKLLTDVQATKSGIRSEMATIAAESTAGDMFIYYHSGHGGQTEPLVNPSNTFVCAYDANYYDSDLAADLAKFHPEVKVFVIIDTCYAAGMFKLSGVPREWPFAKRVMESYKRMKSAELRSKGLAVPKTLGNNIAFMTACDYDEVSWESGSHGLYTGFLLNGCALAEVDTNNDGEYQFLELHVYAAAKAAEVSSGYPFQQNAQAYNEELLGNTVVRAFGSRLSGYGVDNDYDGDGISDLAIYHEDTGRWYIWSLTKGVIGWGILWGGPGYTAVTGDYDGDGTADLAVYNEATGDWYIWSLTKGVIAWDASWGGPGLAPVVGDYSGNGSADLALYYKNGGNWYIVTINGQSVLFGKSLTGGGFTAVPGDYDGDGVSDYAMYHDSMGYWYVVASDGSALVWGTLWGGEGYIPVPGDYDGDGVFDLAVYSVHTGRWHVWSYSQNAVIASNLQWGSSDFIPVSGDYTGNGIWDMAVYNEKNGAWFIRSADGLTTILNNLQFGGPGFVPVRGLR